MKRGDEITVPAGYKDASGHTARVVLCAGKGVTVWLVYANQLPQAERTLWIDKKDLKNGHNS